VAQETELTNRPRIDNDRHGFSSVFIPENPWSSFAFASFKPAAPFVGWKLTMAAG
jgi:hypothetical protein